MYKPEASDQTQAIDHALSSFQKLKEACRVRPVLSYDDRVDILRAVEKILMENDEAICDAVSQDFGNRSRHETKLLEIAPALMGIRYTIKRLKRWMKTRKRHTSLVFFGAKSRVMPQAKGVVGVIAPWNYPLFLVVSPLTSAVAAGNRVMVKQAANSQNLCRLLQKKFSEKISEDLISILPGVGSGEFSSLPFDHMVFTGSPNVGRIIMQTASKNLVPVTLELGGKSPTVLGDDFDLATAVKRIFFAKTMNSGQTCVAPDYLFVPEAKLESFISMAEKTVPGFWAGIHSKDYTAIIDSKAFERLKATLEDAESKGARVINLLSGALFDETLQKISPTIVTDVTEEMIIMQDEIFGPLLPIKTYRNVEEVIDYINQHERPLALYPFSNDPEFLDKIIQNTISGGVTVNDCAMHVAQHDIPFGGIGNSGMGQYHGYEGFCEFSKLKPVFIQAKKARDMTPPYGKNVEFIYKLAKKIKILS